MYEADKENQLETVVKQALCIKSLAINNVFMNSGNHEPYLRALCSKPLKKIEFDEMQSQILWLLAQGKRFPRVYGG